MTTETLNHDGNIRNYYGNEFYGVILDQTEDGDTFAVGHVEPRRMCAAMSAYNKKIIGERYDYCTYAELLVQVKHDWAIPYTAEELAPRHWEWGYHRIVGHEDGDHEVDEHTPGAVPITIVRS